MPARVAKSEPKPGQAWILPIHRAAFYELLGRQLKAGLPLSASLRNVAGSQPPRPIAAALADARTLLEQGEALSVALARHPDAFPAHDVGFLHAAELAGSLPAACQHLADDYRARHQRAWELVARSSYPLFLLMAAIVLLPIPAAVRGGVSAYMAAALPGIIGLVIVAVLGAWLAVMPSAMRARHAITRLALKLPWVGERLRELGLARTVRLLAACVAAGLPPAECFRAAERATGDPAVARACQVVAGRLQRGNTSIAGALAATGGVFPTTLRNIIATGEESGTLDESLARAASDWEATGHRALGLLFGLGRFGLMACVFAWVGWRISAELMHHLAQMAPLLE